MNTSLQSPNELAALYYDTLLKDSIPFWLRHGLERFFFVRFVPSGHWGAL